MKRISHCKVTTLAGLVGAAAVLSGCSEVKDLRIANSCDQPIVIGDNNYDTDYWYPLAVGEQMVIDIGGLSSVLFTILPADAEQVANPIELEPKEFDWMSTETGIDVAELDLAARSLCP